MATKPNLENKKIICLVEKDEELFDGYKDLFFPNQKKEYELVYDEKEM